MKKWISNITKALSLCIMVTLAHVAVAQNEYIDRFTTLRNKIKDSGNGYFSKDGLPYHSPETLICEAPDYGHESTSEAYSYWIWLEAMYGRVQGDWTPLANAWTKMENFAIPTTDLQPTAGDYNANAPATYAAEWPLPSFYPSALRSSVPVGQDPVSPELTATYGNAYVYGMHWIFDLDNFYGYGKKGDGISTPSFINTFQRGPQESVWETVPQPTWDDFKWGSTSAGYLSLFTAESNPASKQWKYTNAPDADARVVQAMYWATQWSKAQGLNPASALPLSKAKKMGDYLRLAMFDKYFKPIGVQNEAGAGGTGYQSAHYLLSWYYAWGGPLTANGWAWRIGCSHSHFGYQNPVAAYALSAVPELIPASPNASRDWNTSLTRQLELYQWLQSAEGAIAGGATNSWNGKYDPYPAGTPTFYNMAYVENPVYEDPGSNTWFGMQAWSMERVAEFYYLTNNARAKAVLDKWVPWVKSVTHLLSNGTYEIPSELGWSGKPNTWTPSAPTANTALHVNIVSYTQDVGVAAALAKALTYYAAATQKYATLDVASRDLAKAILDRMWTNYYEPTGKGVAYPEKRPDYHRFFDQEVYIPSGWTGKMPNGDVIQPGVKFIDIRSKYKSDPDWPALVAARTAGTDFVKTYHRFWAQADVALANAEYGFFFGGGTINHAPVAVATATPTTGIAPLVVAFNASGSTDSDTGDVLTFSWAFGDNTTGTGATPTHTYTVAGIYNAVVTVSDGKGGSSTATVVITATSAGNHNPVAVATATPTTGSAPLTVAFNASGSTDPDTGDVLTFSWTFGDNTTGTGATPSHTYTAAGTYSAVVTVTDGKGGSSTATVVITVTPAVTNCNFGAPLATKLPSISTSYSKVYKLGTGGPTLSNVSTFTINWDLQNNGLWQMSFNTNNGSPAWYSDLRTVSVARFNQVQPDITFTNSGFAGLDGAYYVAIDNGNFVMVSKTGGFTLYFSNSATAPVCAASARMAISEEAAVELNNVNVYPNPFKDMFTIGIVKPELVNGLLLYDQLGRVVVSVPRHEIKPTIEINQPMPKGLYILKVKTLSGNQMIKVIKD